MKKTVVFNIASVPSRIELLKKTIASVINQVDYINVALNGYNADDYHKLRQMYDYEKVSFLATDNTMGDAMKFRWVDVLDCYYLTGDDDIAYPKTYVKDMVKAIDKFGIVSHHGRTFQSFPINSYYHPEEPSRRFHCLHAVEFNEPVQFAGTGVMGFHTDNFKPPFEIFKKKNLADIFISLYADSVGMPIWVLKHDADYFKYLKPTTTIWDEDHLNDEYQTNLVNDYFSFKIKIK